MDYGARKTSSERFRGRQVIKVVVVLDSGVAQGNEGRVYDTVAWFIKCVEASKRKPRGTRPTYMA